jgi:hypothetical protein
MSVLHFGPPAAVTANERACASQKPPFSEDDKDISNSLKKLLVKVHPDRSANKSLAGEVVQKITDQREYLSKNAWANRTKCTTIRAADKTQILERLAAESNALQNGAAPPAATAADAGIEAARERGRQQAQAERDQKRQQREAEEKVRERIAAAAQEKKSEEARARAKAERDRREKLLVRAARAREEKEEDIVIVAEVDAPLASRTRGRRNRRTVDADALYAQALDQWLLQGNEAEEFVFVSC